MAEVITTLPIDTVASRPAAAPTTPSARPPPHHRAPRVVFMGTPPFAASVLSALLDARAANASAFDVVAAWCQPDRRSGRGRKVSPPAVKVVAQAHDVPVYQPMRLRDGEAEQTLRAARPDVVVVAAYGRILPPALLQVAPHGCINVHASLLPRWRGASPINHSILHGDAASGVSIMQMDVGCDTGAVFVQAQLPLHGDETAGALTDKLAALGAQTLVQHLPAILARTCHARAQPEDGITHAGLLEKQDGALQFTDNAAALARRVRALTPWPSAYTHLGELRVLVLGAHPAPSDDTAYGQRAGEVLEAGAKGLRIACGRGSLWLTHVKPAGSMQMHAAQWIAGRGPARGATLRTRT